MFLDVRMSCFDFFSFSVASFSPQSAQIQLMHCIFFPAICSNPTYPMHAFKQFRRIGAASENNFCSNVYLLDLAVSAPGLSMTPGQIFLFIFLPRKVSLVVKDFVVNKLDFARKSTLFSFCRSNITLKCRKF